MKVSGSSVERVLACPASAALPQAQTTSEYAERGIAGHRFIAKAKKAGREVALDEVAEEYRDMCEGIDLDSIPDARVEVAMVYDAATDKARIVGEDIGRQYGDLGPFEIPCTTDLLGRIDDAVYVGDVKLGHGDVTPAKDNQQLAFGALAASRALGLDDAVVEVLRAPNGRVWRDRATLDMFDLADMAARVRDLFERVAVQQSLIAKGQAPDVKEGSWCKYCPAQPACPAKTALIKRLASGDEFTELDLMKPLTPELAGIAWERLAMSKRLLQEIERRVRAAISEYGEVPLPNGNVLREVTAEGNERLDGETVFRVLTDRRNPEVARRAVRYTATKKDLRAALKAGLGQGETLAKAERETLDAIRAEGGAKRGATTKLEEVPAALPKGDAA